MSLPGPELIEPPATPQASVKGSLWRIGRITLGLSLLLLGIAGLFLPVLQGWLTIFAALAILRKDLPWAAYVWEHWVTPLQARVQRWLHAWRQRSS